MPPIDRCCAIVGVQPPPLHGMSSMNARMARLLKGDDASAIIDLAVHQPCGRAAFVLARIRRAVAGNIRLMTALRAARARIVYLSLSGGWGQALDLSFVLLARLLRARLIVHHHSFAYLDRPRRLAALVFAIAGRGATHVALCEVMERRLQELYGPGLDIVAVSNAALLGPSRGAPGRRTALRTVSFLGNITWEKGIAAFLEVAGRLRDSGLRFQIGGPFAGAEVEKQVRGTLAALPNVTYVGPVYGDAKARFLAAADALLFPSQYRNEAEPLVIYEALSCGTPVIATRRGCIASIVDASCGRVVDPADDFAAEAEAQLDAWRRNAATFRAASAAARRRSRWLQQRYSVAAARLIAMLGAGAPRARSVALAKEPAR